MNTKPLILLFLLAFFLHISSSSTTMFSKQNSNYYTCVSKCMQHAKSALTGHFYSPCGSANSSYQCCEQGHCISRNGYPVCEPNYIVSVDC